MKKKPADEKSRPLVIEGTKDETRAQSMARVMTGPYLRHGVVANALTDKMMGKLPGEPRFDDYAGVLKSKAEAAAKGDLNMVSEMLTTQALTLDAMFTEMARRSCMNMGEYVDAADRYARLALKAQANSRATLEALAKLHQPREQTVKHVHINQGAQAVVADHFHQHRGDGENVQSSEQSHATAPTSGCAALPSPDAQGDTVPVPSSKREATLQDARRKQSGSA